jgi:internalin A
LHTLDRILDRSTHPADKHNFIVELMKKFELCYEVNPGTVLIPSLLQIKEPIFKFDSNRSVRIYVEYDFLPKSVMPRFIVKMHNDINGDLRWRTGVVLKNDMFGTVALVSMDEVERRISVHSILRLFYLYCETSIKALRNCVL